MNATGVYLSTLFAFLSPLLANPTMSQRSEYLSLFDMNMFQWDHETATRYIDSLLEQSASLSRNYPHSPFAKDTKTVAETLVKYMRKKDVILQDYRSPKNELAIEHVATRHIVGSKITLGDFYNSLGFVISIIERLDERVTPWSNEIEEVLFYGKILIRFCKLCLILHHHFFRPLDSRRLGHKDVERGGLPATACIVWGKMGPTIHAIVREEAQDGQGYMLGTSIPYPTEFSSGHLRVLLTEMRQRDVLDAIPSAADIELEPDAPYGVGPCAEQPIFTSIAMPSVPARSGSFKGIAVDILAARGLQNDGDVPYRLFKPACNVCMKVATAANLNYEDKVRDIRKLKLSVKEIQTPLQADHHVTDKPPQPLVNYSLAKKVPRARESALNTTQTAYSVHVDSARTTAPQPRRSHELSEPAPIHSSVTTPWQQKYPQAGPNNETTSNDDDDDEDAATYTSQRYYPGSLSSYAPQGSASLPPFGQTGSAPPSSRAHAHSNISQEGNVTDSGFPQRQYSNHRSRPPTRHASERHAQYRSALDGRNTVSGMSASQRPPVGYPQVTPEEHVTSTSMIRQEHSQAVEPHPPQHSRHRIRPGSLVPQPTYTDDNSLETAMDNLNIQNPQFAIPPQAHSTTNYAYPQMYPGMPTISPYPPFPQPQMHNYPAFLDPSSLPGPSTSSSPLSTQPLPGYEWSNNGYYDQSSPQGDPFATTPGTQAHATATLHQQNSPLASQWTQGHYISSSGQSQTSSSHSLSHASSNLRTRDYQDSNTRGSQQKKSSKPSNTGSSSYYTDNR
ncbi:hypothetical protein QCA50_016894 [Cerrena zonata]|uniref:Uncharacterized protein n=1 Tax=Cerrena zonata TaxID=2478898 RepID=A0AAW0FG26_9APHY